MKATMLAKSFDRPATNAVVHTCEHAGSVGVEQECRIKAERLATLIQNGQLLARSGVPQPGSVWTTGEQQPIIGADVQLVGTFLLSPELLERAALVSRGELEDADFVGHPLRLIAERQPPIIGADSAKLAAGRYKLPPR